MGMNKRIASAVLAALTVGVLAVAPAAQAKDGDVIQRGSCTGSSEWKLKLSPENGRIEAEFEVDQNRAGEVWRVKIRHDGELAFRGRRTTRGASGSFSVRIVEDDLAGTDRFVGRARNVATDEVCKGIATF
jgi:hypothetical protein